METRKMPEDAVSLGGDISASYDGHRYVDLWNNKTGEHITFATRSIFERAVSLFPADYPENW